MTFDSNSMAFSTPLQSSGEFQLLEKIKQIFALGPQAQNSALRLRREAAERWMATEVSALEFRFSGALGEATRLLIQSAISNQPSTPEDIQTLGQIEADLAKGFSEPEGLRALLAAMCLKPADRLGTAFDFSSLPEWLMDPAMTYLLLRRNYFTWPGDVERHCAHLDNVVASALKSIQVSDPKKADMIAAHCLLHLDFVPFYFQQGNPRPIIEKRGCLFQSLYPPSRSILPPPSFGPAAAKGRIRLGVLRPHFEHGAETCATLPIFEHLDRSRFDITLLAMKTTQDPLAEYCASRADRAVVLSDDLEESARAIRDYDLDLLFYGTNMSCSISALTVMGTERLARVQVSSICSPFSTGLPEMDVFIAGTLAEPDASAENDYSEELVRMEGSAVCFSFSDRPRPSGLPLDRASLGIPGSAVVFASGANFYKLLPELRESWVKILAATPGSRLLIYPFSPGWGTAYASGELFESLKRLFHAHGVDKSRLISVATLPSSGDVLELLRSADIYLDSFPYSGATSLQDPLEVGIPIVAMDGRTHRFAQASAFLRELGLEELIARDPDDYVELAVKLGSDADYRLAIGQRIQAGMAAKPPFLDSVAFAKKISPIFEAIVEKWNLKHGFATTAF